MAKVVLYEESVNSWFNRFKDIVMIHAENQGGPPACTEKPDNGYEDGFNACIEHITERFIREFSKEFLGKNVTFTKPTF